MPKGPGLAAPQLSPFRLAMLRHAGPKLIGLIVAPRIVGEFAGFRFTLAKSVGAIAAHALCAGVNAGGLRMRVIARMTSGMALCLPWRCDGRCQRADNDRYDN